MSEQKSGWERGRPRPHAGETPTIPEMQDTGLVISCRDLSKTFTIGEEDVPVLKGINLEVRRGERLAIVGASGSGKSTLLHLLGGLDNASSGSVQIFGQEMQQMNETQRGELRNRALGFVYQFHHLLPEFTALENVMLPVLLNGTSVPEASTRAQALLESVGLGHRLRHKPGELSGGERQRAAVARALVNRPACMLGDEPTGNLDEKTAGTVFELMLALNREHHTALVLVTHDRRLARRLDRVLELHEGKLRQLQPDEV